MLCRLLQVGKLNRNFSISIESHLRGSTFGETAVRNAFDYFEIGPVWRCHFEKMATLKQKVGGGALIKNHSPATKANKKQKKTESGHPKSWAIQPSQIENFRNHCPLPGSSAAEIPQKAHQRNGRNEQLAILLLQLCFPLQSAQGSRDNGMVLLKEEC